MKKMILLIAFVFLLSSCNNIKQTDSKINIVTTNFPAYDFARQIAGDNADIMLLLPPGSESHSFEPSPKDIVNIQSADLFIYNGSESDSWIDNLKETIEIENTVAMFAYADTLYTDEGYDEHVWCSPVNAISIVKAIYEELCLLNPENAESYTINRDKYIKELQTLDEIFKEIVSSSEKKTVVFADRFPVKYFTEEYGLSHFSAYPGCSSEAEPSASTIASLIQKVNTEKISGVFYIEFSNEKIADIVCEETGCEKYLFHSCHNISKSDFENGETYVSIMYRNADNLRKALN